MWLCRGVTDGMGLGQVSQTFWCPQLNHLFQLLMYLDNDNVTFISNLKIIIFNFIPYMKFISLHLYVSIYGTWSASSLTSCNAWDRFLNGNLKTSASLLIQSKSIVSLGGRLRACRHRETFDPGTAYRYICDLLVSVMPHNVWLMFRGADLP